MSTYVLVHGGWHGGWCWDAVAIRLRAQGHQVLAPTLTGLAERAHLIDAVTSPDVHVADITNLMIWKNLRDVVLVGHSYGGMVITGVATRCPERIRHLVFLDAFVPTRDHQSAAEMSTPERTAEIAASAPTGQHRPPSGFERWSEDPDTIAWLKRMTTPHPAGCFGKGVSRITDPSEQPFERSYIHCARHDPSPFGPFYDSYRDDPRWQCHQMDCLHDAMLDRPEALTALLVDMY